ncbi:MAG TPA: T9SS type A sorting domain-containing protein [Bacteroidota bacterium]|nr:T9SS type A sorting domain-containing protein [Bacteroidota bacterium]
MNPSIKGGIACLAALTLVVACALSAQISGSAGHSIGNPVETDESGSSVIAYHEKWNLVSTPFILSNDSVHVTFPTASSGAYLYAAGGYQFREVLTPGIGYWLRFPAAVDVTISGSDIPEMTLNLAEGWNLIGSISGPVAVANVSTDDATLILSPFFSFGYAAGYFEIDTIHPGYGYWVYTNHAGSITLSGAPMTEYALNSELSSGLSREVRRAVTIRSNGELPPAPPMAEDVNAPLIPDTYFLDQSYPNPFNPSTTIRFQLPADSRVTLTIHDILGRPVVSVYEGIRAEGYHSFEWNAGDRASGSYFYRLTAVNLADPGAVYSTIRKLILLR